MAEYHTAQQRQEGTGVLPYAIEPCFAYLAEGLTHLQHRRTWESLAPGREALTPRLSCISAGTPGSTIEQTTTVLVESIRQRDHTFLDRVSATLWL